MPEPAKPECDGARPASRLATKGPAQCADPDTLQDQEVLVVDMSYDTVTGVPALLVSS
jgi:hypothetical protein